jgi:sulfite dehydrogenase (quinone) subunit SoeC
MTFFTIFSGAGSGLLFWLAAARLFHGAAPSVRWWCAMGVAGLLVSAAEIVAAWSRSTRRAGSRGSRTIASPAMANFDSRWWPRRVAAVIALYPLAIAYAFAVLWAPRGVELAAGVAVMALSLFGLISTACHFGSRSDVARWSSWPARAALPVLGLMSGALLLSAIVPVAAAPVTARIAGVLLLIGAALKAACYLKFADAGPAGGSVVTGRAGVAPLGSTATLSKIFVFAAGFGVPFVLLSLSPRFAPAAALVSFAGLVVERWLFFAEAGAGRARPASPPNR